MQDRSEYFKDYRKANKEKIAAYENAWREDNKEKRKPYLKAYREANKERIAAYENSWREANKQKILDNVKAWREDNIDKVNASNAKRRAAKIDRTPGWLSKEDLDKIESIYKEAQRLREETGEKWHVDHIIPLQGENISGLHVPDNLQVIRAKDNLRKYNRYTI